MSQRGMNACLRCGGDLEVGALDQTYVDLAADITYTAPEIGSAATGLAFIIPGTPTSSNPISAFKQGLAGEPTDRRIPVFAWRCPACGFVELRAPTPAETS